MSKSLHLLTAGLLALFFCVLCAQYVAVTPYRTAGHLVLQRDPATGQPLHVDDIGAPDEKQHANYVNHLLTLGSFPELKVGDGENYQSHQPPLYYMVAAATAKIAQADPTAPSGRTIRYLGVVFGLATLAGVYFAARWGTGSEVVALAAAAFVGLNPMFLALNAAVSNDGLLFAITTWGFALCIRLAQPDSCSRDLIWLTLLAGLGLLTKTTAIVLLPLGMVAIWMQPHARPKRLAILVIGSLLIASPWLIRNTVLYGDPLALRIFNEAFAGSPKTSDLVSAFGAVPYWKDWFGYWTLRSGFGAFGQMDIFYGANVYRLLWAVALLILAGNLLSARKQMSIPSSTRILSWVLVGLVSLLYLRFNLTYFQAQSRYLFPAVGAVGLFFALGLRGWSGKWFAAAVWVCLIGMVAGNEMSLSYVQAEFAQRVP